MGRIQLSIMATIVSCHEVVVMSGDSRILMRGLRYSEKAVCLYHFHTNAALNSWTCYLMYHRKALLLQWPINMIMKKGMPIRYIDMAALLWMEWRLSSEASKPKTSFPTRVAADQSLFRSMMLVISCGFLFVGDRIMLTGVLSHDSGYEWIWWIMAPHWWTGHRRWTPVQCCVIISFLSSCYWYSNVIETESA